MCGLILNTYICIIANMVYHIVEFPNDNGDDDVAIVPHTWFKDKKTVFWPPYKSSTRLNNAVKKNEPPSPDTWGVFTVTRVLYSNGNLRQLTPASLVIQCN